MLRMSKPMTSLVDMARQGSVPVRRAMSDAVVLARRRENDATHIRSAQSRRATSAGRA